MSSTTATGSGVAAPRRTRHWQFGLGLLLALAALAYGAQYFISTQYLESTDDAYVGGDVSSIAPQVSGQVVQVAVVDNQTVQAGQLLVRLDDSLTSAAVNKAKANVAGARATLNNLAATEALQQAVIAQAAADIGAANAALALAADNEARYAKLAESHAGSLQDAQTARATYAQATAAAAKARAGLRAANLKLGVITTQKQQATASLAAALATQQQAEVNQGYTQIRAPFAGVVGNRAAHVGDYAATGTPLLSLVPVQGLWVDANFKENQLSHMRPGQSVNIVADIAPSQKISGHVLSLSPASGAVFSILPAQNATGNFTKIVQRVPVRIMLDGSASNLGLLRPGLSVSVTVNTK